MNTRMILGLLISLVAVFVPAAAQNGTGTRVDLLSQRVEAPTNVTVDVRVSEGGRVVTDLDPSNFSLNGDQTDDIDVTTLDDENIELIFLVDTGQGSDIDNIRTVLRSYFENDAYYREGDTITLFTMTGNGNLATVSTANSAEILQSIANLTVNENFSRPTEVLPNVLAEAQSAGRPVQVVYLGTLLFNATGLEEQLTRFANANVPIHVIQTHAERETEEFERIANSTGGVYINNNNNSFIGTGSDGFFALDQLESLFTRLNENRIYHRVAYRSTAPGNEERAVTLVVTPPSGVPGEVSFTYEPSFTAPRVEIVQPTNLNPTRRFDPEGNLSTPQATVFLSVIFPDGVRRGLETVRLEFLDVSGNPLQSPVSIENPSFDPGEDLTLSWSLEDYNEAGTSTRLTLNVEVVDEFGLSATAQQVASVNVGLIPTLPPVGEPVIPAVEIVEPRPIAPIRNFVNPETTDLDNAVVRIVLDVVLPQDENDVRDAIRQIDFIVTDPETSAAKQRFSFNAEVLEVTDPDPDDNAVSVAVPWDIRPYEIAETTTDLTVEAFVSTVGGQQISSGPQPATVTVGSQAVQLPRVCQWITFVEDCDTLILGLQAAQIGIIVLLVIIVIFLAATRRGREMVAQGVTNVTRATGIFNTADFPTTGNAAGAARATGPTVGHLIVRQGGNLIGESVIHVTKPIFTLGRHLPDGVDHVIKLPGISRRHFTLYKEGSQFFIEDHEAANGTYINGKRIPAHMRHPVRPGDRIRLSKIELEWQPGEKATGGAVSFGATGGETMLEIPAAPDSGTHVQNDPSVPEPPGQQGYTAIQSTPKPPGPRAGYTEVQQIPQPPDSNVPDAPAGAGYTSIQQVPQPPDSDVPDAPAGPGYTAIQPTPRPPTGGDTEIQKIPQPPDSDVPDAPAGPGYTSIQQVPQPPDDDVPDAPAGPGYTAIQPTPQPPDNGGNTEIQRIPDEDKTESEPTLDIPRRDRRPPQSSENPTRERRNTQPPDRQTEDDDFFGGRASDKPIEPDI